MFEEADVVITNHSICVQHTNTFESWRIANLTCHEALFIVYDNYAFERVIDIHEIEDP